MIRSKHRMMLCISLIVCNIAFIWVNSMLPREVSAAFSKLVGRIMDWFLPSQGTLAEGEGNGILRKIAHFTEFCTLGILTSWLAQMLSCKKWQGIVIPFAFGVSVACIDELIQKFNPGRGPGFLDVCIDAAGVALGIGILIGIAYGKRKKTVQ